MTRARINQVTADLIAAALKTGQMHKRMLCAALNCEYQRIDATMAEMRRRGQIVVLATAKQAGYTDINAHAPVYGLPGMVLQKIAPKPAQIRGVVAPSREPSGFRPLARDFFAHWRLAMMTRR